MESSKYNKLYIWFALFILILVGTNLANYYFFAARLAPDPVDVSDTGRGIRYEPERTRVDDEAKMFFEALDSISQQYYYTVEMEDLIEGAVRGMIDALDDPQVRFYDPEELEELLLDTRGSYGGVGIRIIEADEDIVVFETFADSPAERSGLSPGDRILEADGQPLSGKGIQRAVELLRGPGHTAVDVKIKRPGADEPINMTIVREEIQVTTVFSEMLGEDGPGYININKFDSNTAEEFKNQLRRLEARGMDTGLILDMRNNPGGLVDQAVEVARQIIPEGEIVRLVGRDGVVRQVFESAAEGKSYPVVVLVNEETASASELIAGALQDRGVALVVGKTTYGKASVQQLEELPGDNAIMLTVANYFTPSGHNIDEYGIIPDYEVDMPDILHYYRYFHPGPLEIQDYGPEVEMLQEMLRQLGYETGAGGYYDEQTARAISDFQVDVELEPSGQFDDGTWVKLREYLDIASRDQDEQLAYAVELFNSPELWEKPEMTNEGNDQ